jgi:hypothetical protein
MLRAGLGRKPGGKTELAQAEGICRMVAGRALRKFPSNALGDHVRPESSWNVEAIVHYRNFISNNILHLHVPAALPILSSDMC